PNETLGIARAHLLDEARVIIRPNHMSARIWDVVRPNAQAPSGAAPPLFLSRYVETLGANLLGMSVVSFRGEEGLDVGGLLKEFLSGVNKEFKETGLFAQSSDLDVWQLKKDFSAFRICTVQGSQNVDALTCYRNIGAMMAKM